MFKVLRSVFRESAEFQCGCKEHVGTYIEFAIAHLRVPLSHAAPRGLGLRPFAHLPENLVADRSSRFKFSMRVQSVFAFRISRA